ncbi:hypothetical protein [bacterium endosymbiont of Bathymodiolus sp. 5 South]|nr:hypothetical protein [bacterium endosymbiont of Bathymodiolus sp. 5 South]SHN93580.1 hypothetical protein BCLUESOX_766 [bacterium endosymbiont of Bathymodiolus sp. 5 South]SSC07405.1 hypothetical protein BTURTLESOX_2310 [bacterium endosymbiont of Bathymodiolus sp. 5 South]VVH59704.1 hypothetical protein BSPCLSOX_422 [uncultured Gammaproteobacteria bacterium]VVH64050.1 hypothetical protein BSPWISOX_2543 [uncultured Gammaproteobacteria bacterium]
MISLNLVLAGLIEVKARRYYNAKQVIMQFPREVQEILDRSLKSN